MEAYSFPAFADMLTFITLQSAGFPRMLDYITEIIKHPWNLSQPLKINQVSYADIQMFCGPGFDLQGVADCRGRSEATAFFAAGSNIFQNADYLFLLRDPDDIKTEKHIFHPEAVASLPLEDKQHTFPIR